MPCYAACGVLLHAASPSGAPGRVQHDQGEHEVKARRRTDNLNLLQAQLEHEQVQRAQEEKIASLKEHLATVVERTTKIRGAYEKEKKQLCAQVLRPFHAVRSHV